MRARALLSGTIACAWLALGGIAACNAVFGISERAEAPTDGGSSPKSDGAFGDENEGGEGGAVSTPDANGLAVGSPSCTGGGSLSTRCFDPIPIIAQKMVVDGIGDEYCALAQPQYTIASGDVITPDGGEANHDEKVRFFVAANATRVAFHAHVDDAVILPGADSPADGDAVYFYLDPGADASPESKLEIAVSAPSAAHPTGLKKEITYETPATQKAVDYDDAKATARLVDGGYEVEIVVDRSDFGIGNGVLPLHYDVAVSVRDDAASSSAEVKSYYYSTGAGAGATGGKCLVIPSTECDPKTWCASHLQ